jgi:ATP-binding cassette subfamily E protein 1
VGCLLLRECIISFH